MTKAELVKSLENVPNDFEVRICTADSYGMSYEPALHSLEINTELQTVFLLYSEEENYL